MFSLPSVPDPELKDREDIPLLLEGVVLNWFGWNIPPHATHRWPLVEVALLLIGLTDISFDINQF
jgi:hypothetical protein